MAKKKYFHHLNPLEALEAMQLPNFQLKREFAAPLLCGHPDPLDKTFGCPFIFKYVLKGRSIRGEKCCICTCKIEKS